MPLRCQWCACSTLIFGNLLLNFLLYSTSGIYNWYIALTFTTSVITWGPASQSAFFANCVFLVFSSIFSLLGCQWFLVAIIIALATFCLKVTTEKLFGLFVTTSSSCEASIICHVTIPYLLLCLISEFSELFLDIVNLDLLHQPTRVLQILFLGLAGTALSIYRLRKFNIITLYLVLSAGIFLTYLRLLFLLEREPFFWLVSYITETENKVFLLKFWASLFILSISYCVVQSSSIIVISNPVSRKFFHLLVTPVFLSGLKYDALFLYFSSACCLWVFIFFEILRLMDPKFAGTLINGLTETLKNSYDQTLIVRTHIYLLTGISSSIWLAPSLSQIYFNFSTGLIGIGIGDTAAAFVGIYLGRHRWPNSNKTVEGTLAAIVTQFVGSILIAKYLSLQITLLEATLFAIVSSLLEALTSQIDNLVLPLYLNIFCLLCEAVKSI